MSKGGSRTDRWHYIACFFHWLAFGTMPQPVFCPGRWMARCQNGLWEHSKAHRRSELQFMMGLRIPETWNLRFHSWSIPARDNSSKGTSSQDSWGFAPRNDNAHAWKWIFSRHCECNEAILFRSKNKSKYFFCSLRWTLKALEKSITSQSGGILYIIP